MRLACFASCFLLAIAPLALAQNQQRIPAAPDPTGTITGHVFCADTNEPARFAEVSLQNIPAFSSAKAPDTNFKPSADTSDAGKVQTTLDGSFTLSHVKPGAYFIVVEKQGYLGPRDLFTAKQINDDTPEMLARRIETIAHVTVEANHTESVEIRLNRGASVSGTVLYDDGTPAGGLRVQLLRQDENGKWIHLGFNGSPGSSITTDDRGIYRAASLLPGGYIVEADLSLVSSKLQHMTLPGGMNVQIAVQTFHSALPFYGTGTAHLAEAKPVTLRSGQETPGQDMMIPIAKLHKLTGRVAAGRDAHFVNAATVALVSRDDNKEIASTDISREDGLFHFDFVPDGDYILKVTEARDVVWETTPPSKDQPFNAEEKERVLASFGNTEEPILLRGDLLGTLATVSPDAAPNAAKPAAVNAQTGTEPDSAAPPKPLQHDDSHAAPQAKSAAASTI